MIPYPHTVSDQPLPGKMPYDTYNTLTLTSPLKSDDGAPIANWPQMLTPTQKANWKATTAPYVLKDLIEQTTQSDSRAHGLDDKYGANRNVNSLYRYVAYSKSQDPAYTNILSQKSLDWISDQITQRLAGVHPEGKNIVVPDQSILGVLDSFWTNSTWYDPQLIREQTVLHIVHQIKNEYELYKQNDSLSIWQTVMTPDKGLQQFPLYSFKFNEKMKNPTWNWNY